MAFDSVWQHYAPTRDGLGLLEAFRRMVNESIRIGLGNNVSSLRRLSLLSYNQLSPARFSQLLQALRHIESSRNTSG
ncbi:hypothetical protein AUI06_00970 [archaeon 13_2_20CM_2_52_21]|nr:MAG: hypothetical protein AUI06_00970 [archaeon 13_2_20CM_2_52_21]